MSTQEIPRFNHVAMSVSRELLSPQSQKELLAFYGEVFGWTAMPGMSKPAELLVMRVHSNEQFVYLAAGDEPMQCPSLDHFGLSVGDPGALYATHERATQWRQRDDRVEITPPRVEDYKVLKLHNFYVGYRLPMKVEVQCYDWAEGMGPDSLPET